MGRGPIDLPSQGLGFLEVVLVRVPIPGRHFDERHARLDQPARQQAARREVAFAIGLAHFLRLAVEFESGHPPAANHPRGALIERLLVARTLLGQAAA